MAEYQRMWDFENKNFWKSFFKSSIDSQSSLIFKSFQIFWLIVIIIIIVIIIWTAPGWYPYNISGV